MCTFDSSKQEGIHTVMIWNSSFSGQFVLGSYTSMDPSEDSSSMEGDIILDMDSLNDSNNEYVNEETADQG